MRLKYAFKFWQNTFLIGFIGLFIFSLLIHNPTSIEIAEYGTEPSPWYFELLYALIVTTPFLFFLTLFSFPLGLIFYQPETLQEATPNARFHLPSLKKKTMFPAYITTTVTCIGLYIFGSSSDMSGMEALVVVAMLMFFLFILAPVNVYIWIRCMKQSRDESLSNTA